MASLLHILTLKYQALTWCRGRMFGYWRRTRLCGSWRGFLWLLWTWICRMLLDLGRFLQVAWGDSGYHSHLWNSLGPHRCCCWLRCLMQATKQASKEIDRGQQHEVTDHIRKAIKLWVVATKLSNRQGSTQHWEEGRQATNLKYNTIATSSDTY